LINPIILNIFFFKHVLVVRAQPIKDTQEFDACDPSGVTPIFYYISIIIIMQIFVGRNTFSFGGRPLMCSYTFIGFYLDVFCINFQCL